MKQLDFSQARAAVQIGGILAANLRPAGPRFYIEFETRGGPAILVKSNGKTPRPFSPLKAFETIRELGLDGGRFSLAQWRPEEMELEKKARPDRAKVMKQAHQAAAQATWIQEQVAVAVVLADSGTAEWVDGDQVDAWLATWGQQDETPPPR